MKRFPLGFLGAGRMGFAIASALIRKKIFSPGQMLMADPDPSARRRATALGIRASADVLDTARRSESILLAVKPQKISEVSEIIRPAVKGKRIISILAGTTRSRLRALLPGSRIVRVMPNTPLLAGKGATAVTRGGSTPADIAFARRLFEPLGKVWLVPESWMNAVTALSGSGPAIFCEFLERYAAAAVSAGLPARLAQDLAIQTFIGTAALLEGSETVSALPPQKLREMVTSPGGTTEAALREFQRLGLDPIVRHAVKSAVRRGRELSAGQAK